MGAHLILVFVFLGSRLTAVIPAYCRGLPPWRSVDVVTLLGWFGDIARS